MSLRSIHAPCRGFPVGLQISTANMHETGFRGRAQRGRPECLEAAANRFDAMPTLPSLPPTHTGAFSSTRCHCGTISGPVFAYRSGAGCVAISGEFCYFIPACNHSVAIYMASDMPCPTTRDLQQKHQQGFESPSRQAVPHCDRSFA